MFEKIEGRIVAQEPISHIGETQSTVSNFKREKTLFRGKIVEIPVISGNALRGVMRRRGSARLLELLEVRKADLGEDVQHALFSGGMLKKGAGGGTIDTNFIADLRGMLPLMSVWGTTIGQQMIGGKLDVGQLVPIACQTATRTGIESNISVHSLMDEVAQTRRDDMEDKTKGADDEQKQQMRYQIEVISAGTEFYHYFTIRDCTSMERGAFMSTLRQFMAYPKLGGMSGRGFGLVKMDYVVDEDAANAYETWVVENAGPIRNYLERLGNL
jgi:CRISPR/Cas system CSM-associated protein Csm3 (group 7 of RAMP superfamily)